MTFKEFVKTLEYSLWLKQELKESQCTYFCVSGTSLSWEVIFYLFMSEINQSIQGALKEHSESPQRALREPSESIQRALREHLEH